MQASASRRKPGDGSCWGTCANPTGDSKRQVCARYSRVLPLAKLVLASRGASMEGGNVVGACFLIPAPGIVESGLRNTFANALSPIDVRKRGSG